MKYFPHPLDLRNTTDLQRMMSIEGTKDELRAAALYGMFNVLLETFGTNNGQFELKELLPRLIWQLGMTKGLFVSLLDDLCAYKVITQNNGVISSKIFDSLADDYYATLERKSAAGKKAAAARWPSKDKAPAKDNGRYSQDKTQYAGNNCPKDGNEWVKNGRYSADDLPIWEKKPKADAPKSEKNVEYHSHPAVNLD